MGYVIAFGQFWFDLLVGHRPELFVGPILGLALVALVIHLDWLAPAGLLLVGSVVASGGWGLARDLAEVQAPRR
jgi:hypothetical protein